MKVEFTPEFEKSMKRMIWRERLLPFNLKQHWRNLKAYYVRGKKGWHYSDTWNFDSYLTQIIAGGVRYLKENHMGIPGKIMGSPLDKKPKMSMAAGDRKWCRILENIAVGFEANQRLKYDHKLGPKSAEYKKLQRQWKKGSKLFIEYYGNLWD